MRTPERVGPVSQSFESKEGYQKALRKGNISTVIF